MSALNTAISYNICSILLMVCMQHMKTLRMHFSVASEKLKVMLLVPVYQLLYTVYLIAATRT